MKIKNGYAKLAEMLGLELGQEFVIIADGTRYLYFFDNTGLYDANGGRNSHSLHQLLSGELDIEITPLLTLEESSYLRTLRTICGNMDTVYIDTDFDGGALLYCLNGGVSVACIVIVDGLFKKLEPTRKYTLAELGLED